MFWVVVAIVVGAVIIAAAVSSAKGKTEQPSAPLLVPSTIKVGQSTQRWSVAIQKNSAMEQVFVLSSDSGISNLCRLKWGAFSNAVALFVNDQQVKQAPYKNKVPVDFSLTFAVEGGEVSARISAVATLTTTTTSIYVSDQFVGQVKFPA